MIKEFELDKDSKDMLTDISSLMGVKVEIVKQVWEYTLFTWFLKISKNPEKLTSIVVPYLGHIGLRYKNEEVDNISGTLKTNVDSFISLSDEFKNMYGNIINEAQTALPKYLQSKIMETVKEK